MVVMYSQMELVPEDVSQLEQCLHFRQFWLKRFYCTYNKFCRYLTFPPLSLPHSLKSQLKFHFIVHSPETDQLAVLPSNSLFQVSSESLSCRISASAVVSALDAPRTLRPRWTARDATTLPSQRLRYTARSTVSSGLGLVYYAVKADEPRLLFLTCEINVISMCR